MGEKERLNAFEVALNNETREREFYLKNAEGYLLNPASWFNKAEHHTPRWSIVVKCPVTVKGLLKGVFYEYRYMVCSCH